EIKGRSHRSPACQTQAEEGMEVITSSPELENLRRSIFELILSEHPYFCLFCQEKTSCDQLKITMAKALEPGGCIFCPKDGDCEVQRVADYLKIKTVSYDFEDRKLALWQSDPFISHNPNLCLLCGRCVRVCAEVRGEYVLSFIQRGPRTAIGTFANRSLREADCSFCGACLEVCPTAAFYERGVALAKNKQTYEQSFICPLCSSGCELKAEFLEDGQLRRIRPAAALGPSFNSGCVRGRFGLKEILARADSQPAVKKETKLQPAIWSEAIQRVAQILKNHRPKEIALIFTEQFASDSLLAFLEFGQLLGIKNLFYFYPEVFLKKIADFEDKYQVKLSRGIRLQRLAEFQTFVLVDCDLKSEALTWWLEVKKQLRKGARLVILDSGLNRSEIAADLSLKCRPGKEPLALLSLLKQVAGKASRLTFYPAYDKLQDGLKELSEEKLSQISGLQIPDLNRATEILRSNQPLVFIFGPRLLRQAHWLQSLAALWNLSLRLEAGLVPITSKINELLIEKLASRYGVRVVSDLDSLAQSLRNQEIKVLYIFGDLPLIEKPAWLIVQNQFRTGLAEQAEVFL
ncbi:MAG: molybdopterin-dependent oxidoreductase, partial [Candidatus Saccharicenans sp.]